MNAILCSILVPGFPIYLFLLLTLPYAFIQGIIAARSVGITGQPLVLPYVQQGVYMLGYSLGYQGIDVWFAPLVISTGGQGYWIQWFKVADLTETTVSSFVKAFIIGIVVSLMSHFIFTQLFWSMAPIPSSTYPATQIFWPVNVSMSIVWVTRQLFVFKPLWLLGSFILSAVIFAFSEITHLPISLIGIATGASMPFPMALSLFVGGVLGKIISRIVGREWWSRSNALIVAGLTVGEGVIVGLVAGIAVIAKAMWTLPF